MNADRRPLPRSLLVEPIRLRHQREIRQHRTWQQGTYCQVCNQRWPCDAAVLLRLYDELRAEATAAGLELRA